MRDTVEAEIYTALVKGREEKQRRESGEAAEQPPSVVSPDTENIRPNLAVDDTSAAHDEQSYAPHHPEGPGGKCCPVCSTIFPSTMMNTEINAHLDSCLEQ